jgi:hypothetical protein
MKSSRTLLWALFCLLPLAQSVAHAQTIVRIPTGQPFPPTPADLPHGMIPPAAPPGQTPPTVIPVQAQPSYPPGQGPSAFPLPGEPPLNPPAQDAAAPAESLNPPTGEYWTPGASLVPDMLSTPLSPSVGVEETRTFTTTKTVITPTPVTTTTLQTSTIRVVKVMPGATVVSFRTITTPVTTTSTVNVRSTVTTPHTQVLQYRIPTAGGYQIADNESPIPQTRWFYYMDNWENVFAAANRGLGNNASLPFAMRNTLGFEQALFDGGASIGLRLPIDTLRVDSSLPGTQADDTAIGDLFLVTKVLFYRTDAGSAVSGGLALTLPTGTRSFAGVSQGDVGLDHHGNLQPYVGYLWRPTEWLFLQGFSSIAVPMNPSDVTLMYNAVGVGCLFTRRYGWLTALAPTAELRVTTPLNHTGIGGGGVYAETQIVQFLAGLTMEMNRQTNLTFGVGVPLTGPQPYDWEFMIQLNYRF